MDGSRNVLVCEDDPVQLKVMEAALRQAGYGILSARSPWEAMATLRGRRTDAVVTDVQLDHGNAFDLVEGLHKAGMDAPVIMMSVYATPGMRKRAAAAGAVEFFEKPCSLGDVVRRVDQAVREHVREKIRARVLVIEDHAPMRALYAAFLKQEGCEIIPAESGVRALEILRSDSSIDLALMDMHVPGPTGAMLVEEMRRVIPGLLVAMVTGEAGYDEIQRGFRSGASALLRKPVVREDLVNFVRSNVARAREQRAEAARVQKRAAEPRTRRALRWMRGYLTAPSGSPKRKQAVNAGVVILFVLFGLYAGSLMNAGVQQIEEAQAKADLVIEKLGQESGWASREMKSYNDAQLYFMGQQIRQADQAGDFARRMQVLHLDSQRQRGFQR
jgi:DNA-binding NtrC family response regulator